MEKNKCKYDIDRKMEKKCFLVTIISLVLLGSCGNISHGETEEKETAEDVQRDTVVIVEHDTVYLKQDSIVFENEGVDDTKIISHSFDVGHFYSLVAGGLLEVSFMESDQYSVVAEGTTVQLKDLVCETKEGILRIYMKPSNNVIVNGNSVNVSGGNGVVIGDVNGAVIIGDGNVIGNSNSVNVTGSGNAVVIESGKVTGNATNASNIYNNSKPIKVVVTGKLSKALALSAMCSFKTESLTTAGDFDIDLSSSAKLIIGKLKCRNLGIEGSSSSQTICASVAANYLHLDGSSSSQISMTSVVVKNINIETSSSSIVTMSVECDNMEIDASSASMCKISGQTKSLEIEKSSAATIDVSRLKRI